MYLFWWSLYNLEVVITNGTDTMSENNTHTQTLTQCVLQIFLSDQFEVLLDSFSAQCVLSEDQVLVLPASIHF